jgi:hypothetical protein
MRTRVKVLEHPWVRGAPSRRFSLVHRKSLLQLDALIKESGGDVVSQLPAPAEQQALPSPHSGSVSSPMGTGFFRVGMPKGHEV